MNRSILITGIILLALAVIFAVVFLMSHLIWHRSMMATFAEWYLWIIKDRSTEEETAQKLAALKSEKEPVYVFSEKLSSTVEGSTYQNLRIFTLNKNDKSSIFIYVHGGAYVKEISPDHWKMIDKVAQKSGCEVRNILYPLAPWHTWEESYDSITAYYAEVRAENPGRKVFLGGDSAGGGLALGVAINIGIEKLPTLDGLILISPWVETVMDNPDISAYAKVDPMIEIGPGRADAKAWAGDTPITNWHISPLYGDFSKLRNVHIFLGTRELLYPDDMLLHERMLEAGVDSHLIVKESMNHVYPTYPIPEATEAIAQMTDILSQQNSFVVFIPTL